MLPVRRRLGQGHPHLLDHALGRPDLINTGQPSLRVTLGHYRVFYTGSQGASPDVDRDEARDEAVPRTNSVLQEIIIKYRISIQIAPSPPQL